MNCYYYQISEKLGYSDDHHGKIHTRAHEMKTDHGPRDMVLSAHILQKFGPFLLQWFKWNKGVGGDTDGSAGGAG